MSIPSNGEDVKLPEAWQKMQWPLIAIGAICLLVSLGGSLMLGSSGPGLKFFFHSYLVNYMFALSFGLGALFFVLIQHLTRAGWSASVRRLAEVMASTIGGMSVLFVPILAMVLFTSSGALYVWNLPLERLEQISNVIVQKKDFLNEPTFGIITLICFGSWIAIAAGYLTRSRRIDESGDVEITKGMERWSGPMVMIYALTVSAAAFTWMMSVSPEWYSTIYGVYLFGSSMLAFFALTIIFAAALHRQGKLKKYITVEHFHDLGKFLFGFVFFWAYIAFSQFMLIWYANIPEETHFYLTRIENPLWWWVGYFIIVGHFVLPFLGLLSRHVRRHRAGLVFWAVWLIVMHWIDFSYLILPNLGDFKLVMLLPHVIGWLGMSAILCSLIIQQAKKGSLVAIRDPRLPEALAFTNPLL